MTTNSLKPCHVILNDMPDPSKVPAWFGQALAQQPAEARIEVEGANIEYLSWGTPGRPAIVFIAGMMAHARWWGFIAPFLADRFHCIALSLSGMGRSDWRPAYSIAGYTREVAAVMQAAGIAPGHAILVAHSFGTMPARKFAEWTDTLAGVIFIDGKVIAPDAHYTPPAPRGRPPRIYKDIAAAIDGFRLDPPQHCDNGFIMRYIASQSLRAAPDGYSWSFDPDLRRKLAHDHYHPSMGSMACPVAFVWGDCSKIIDDDTRTLICTRFPHSPKIELVDARHHVMLDQPIALIAALDGLLATWPARPSLATA